MIAEDQSLSSAQLKYSERLRFPDLQKPTPINHFHPKHKPVYQEIVRPANSNPPQLDYNDETENENSYLLGKIEYPSQDYDPELDQVTAPSAATEINSNDADYDAVMPSSTNSRHENQEVNSLRKEIQLRDYNNVPSTDRTFSNNNEITTSYMINVPISHPGKEETADGLRPEVVDDFHTRQDKTLGDNFVENIQNKDNKGYTSLHQKIPSVENVLLGKFKPKHPKQYHEIRRGSDLQDPAAERSAYLITTTVIPPPATTIQTDTTARFIGERNTTIISIQELKNRFTTRAPLNKIENILKSTRVPEYVGRTETHYPATKRYASPNRNPANKLVISSLPPKQRIETQVRDPYSYNEAELLRSQQSQKAYGSLGQRVAYQSVPPSITPPQYYSIDYDDRVSPRPRQYKYKWNQPSTEAIRSLDTYNNPYHQSPPPKRYYQIQRKRHQNHPNTPVPYPPIPTYPSNVETTPQAADRRYEFDNIDHTTQLVTSTQKTYFSEPTTMSKAVASKGN